MPTFNQLVRKGRKVQAVKSTAPALQKGYNAKKKVTTDQSSPQKRGVHRSSYWYTEEAELCYAENCQS